MGALDVPVSAGRSDQLKEYLYNEIVKYVPNLDLDPNLVYGDLELIYLRYLNDGVIPSTSDIDRRVIGSIGDGITEDTAAFQLAANAGGTYYVPAGTYLINSVSLTKSVSFICAPGVVFKRKNGVAVSSAGWAGSGMFVVNATGITVQFSDFTYDGNKANQTSVEPDGMFLKVAPPAVITSSPIKAYITRGNFINGTLGYLLFRGDDVQRRYETLAYVDNCNFSDTVYGKGSGDPGTPTALGYSPTYVMVMDYVRLRTFNFRAEFLAATGTGLYAPCAINGTFWGGSYANSGESSVFCHGTTFLNKVGRANRKYDDTPTGNNGIGAIDMYGNGETLYVENVIAIGCENVVIRAKGSLRNYTVVSANLTNCARGLQVGPSSTGACETTVKVGNCNSYGGAMPQLEFVGTLSTDRLRQVTIDSANLIGPFTNPESLATQGIIHVRNVTSLKIDEATVTGSPLIGVSCIDVKNAVMLGLNIDTTAGVGVHLTGGDNHLVSGFTINATSAAGINIATNPKKTVIANGRISNAVDYGVFGNVTTTELLVLAVELDTITGLNRGFYGAGGNVSFIGNKSNAGTHVWPVSGVRKRERDNSWNAAVAVGSAAPTTGTYSVGDIVWNTAPAASGTMGWVCTTAGTPGTWKTFGTIAA